MRCPDVPKPRAVAALPVDPRGFPIFAACRRPEGGHNFQVLDPRVLLKLLHERRCGVCGLPLGLRFVFIGGPRSAEHRIFKNPAMHPPCADYAAAVCPYIVAGGWDRTRLRDAARVRAETPAVSLARPDQLYRYLTDRYELHLQAAEVLVRAGRPLQLDPIAPPEGEPS